MRSQLPRLKANLIVGKLVLLLVNFLLILALGEWLFPKFLDKIPLRLYGSIENNLRILAQHSKKNLLPNEYIAIVGDSIAVGAGDWLEEERNSFFGSPDYSPAHLIYKKTGIDVVSFGQAGVGSFGGIWREPITQFKYINSVREYHLSPPKYILIFFSEAKKVLHSLYTLFMFSIITVLTNSYICKIAVFLLNCVSSLISFNLKSISLNLFNKKLNLNCSFEFS